VVVGLVGWPEALGGSNRFHHWLAPVIAEGPFTPLHEGHALEIGLAAASVIFAVTAIWFAGWVYKVETDKPARFASAIKPLYLGALHKWYVDEVYDALIVNPIKAMTSALNLFDKWVVDGLVNLARHVTVGTSWISKHFDLKVIDLAVNAVGWTIRGFGRLGRLLQTGRLQSYAYYFILGVFIMVCYYLAGIGR